jgi:K+-sensing histidine kinase KdpD
MLVVALTISTLTTRIAQQAEGARERERRTASLYQISQALVRTAAMRDLLQAGITHISETFAAEAIVLLPDALGQLAPGPRVGDSLDLNDRSWLWPSGYSSTDTRPPRHDRTLPGASIMYLPRCRPAVVVMGVLGVGAAAGPLRAPEQLHLLETFAALIAVAVDQARAAEEARRIRQLEEMDRLKGEFVAVASHELRSPITSLVMEVDLLRERLAATIDERSLELLEAAAEDTGRLRALVDDLLDLSRLEAGRMVLQRSSIPVDSLLEQATSAYRVPADEKGVQLAAEAAPDLPPVSADEKQVARVLANLLANAIRSTPAGGRILLAADSIGDFVQLSVADNGEGIALEDQPRLFDRFVHLGRKRDQEGSGLGLAISREIVRAHGGDIWVDSGPGPGAVFSFTLPVAQSSHALQATTTVSDA